MARTKGTLLDNTRGRVGPVVFSQNGSSNYVRMYKKSTNPNSLAQQNQRNRFRTMSGGFGALTQAIQQGWADFASGIFNPLRKINKGQFSAIMAFKATKLVIQACNDRAVPVSITFDSGTPSVTLTSLAIAMPVSAPINTVRPDIYDTATSNLPYQITNCTLSSAGAITASIVFSGAAAAGITGTSIKDENSTKQGFSIYISDPVHNIGYRPRNQFFQNLGFTGIFQTTTPTAATHKKLNLIMNCSSLIPNFKKFVLVGQIVLMTIVVVGENGTLSVCGSQYVTIT
jgi:hypothetical protein